MRLPWALSLGLFWYFFSQGVYHGLFLGDIFQELFRMDNLQGVFAGAFSVLSVARLFPRAFFRNGGISGLILRIFSVRFFGVVFCVPSFPGASSCVFFSAFLRAFSGRSILLAPYRRRFCLALLSRASFPSLLSQSFFGTPFCRAFPMGYSPVHLPCELAHGRFPWTLSQGLLKCSLWGLDFWFNFFRVFLRAIFCRGDFNGSICGGHFLCALSQGFRLCNSLQELFTCTVW